MKKLFFAILLVLFGTYSLAQEYHWAGVGFLGDYGKRELLYPVAAKVFDDKSCDGTSCFEVHSRNVFANKNIANGTVKLTQAEAGTSAIGVALGISYERLIVDKTPDSEHTDKNILNNIVIFGNLIFMDLDKNTLLGAVPTYISYHEAANHSMTAEEREDITRKLLIGNELGINLAEDALTKAQSYILSSSQIMRAQISNVHMDTEAKKILNLTDQEEQFLTLQIAQISEGVLMNKSSIQMLPSKVGHVIGGKLKTRLSSGDRTIELPEPDIAIKLELNKLARFEKTDTSGSGSTVCFASKINFSATDSFGDKIFDASVRNVPCSYIRKGTVIEHTSSYEKSIISLLSNSAKAIVNPEDSDDFFKNAAPKNVDETKKAFLNFNTKLIKQAR